MSVLHGRENESFGEYRSVVKPVPAPNVCTSVIRFSNFTLVNNINLTAANPVDRYGVCSEILAAQPSTTLSYTACDAKRC